MLENSKKDSGHIGKETKFVKSKGKTFKKWNNSFTFAVDNEISNI